MTLTGLLAQFDVREDDMVVAVKRRLAKLALSGAVDMTAAEAAFWDEHSGMPASTRASRGAVALTAVGDILEQAAGSLTIGAAAALLDLDPTRVRHKLGAGELYAFTLGSQRRLPRWQFTSSGALPGLARVLAALPASLDAATVEGFFTGANPDLGLRSPAQWLASGGDPAAVVGEVAGLDQ